METYANRNHSYALAHGIVKHTGQFGVEPAELKSLVTASGIVLSNGANGLTTFANISSLCNVYTQAAVDDLLGVAQNRMSLINDNTKIQLRSNNNDLNYLPAGHNIELTNDVAYVRFDDIAVELSSYYTQTTVSKLLNARQDIRALLNRNTKLQLLNNNNVLKAISTCNNIVLTNDTAIGQSVECSA